LYNKQASHPTPSTPTPSTQSNQPINPPASCYSSPTPLTHPVQQTHYIPFPGLVQISNLAHQPAILILALEEGREGGTVSVFIAGDIEDGAFDGYPDWFGAILAIVEREFLCRDGIIAWRCRGVRCTCRVRHPSLTWSQLVRSSWTDFPAHFGRDLNDDSHRTSGVDP
jgi:hypothetical protein